MGPAQPAAAQDVEVEMWHGVARDVAHVEHQAVPVRDEPFATGDCLGSDEEVGDVVTVLDGHTVGVVDVYAGVRRGRGSVPGG